MKHCVLIVGSDANAYYMARCAHEEYGTKPFVLAKSPLPYTRYSSILNLFYDDSIWTEEGFIKALSDFRGTRKEEKILLVSSNESYARMMVKHRECLEEMGYVFNYPNLEILDSLMMKDLFYKTYADSVLDLPETHYFDCAKPDPIPESLHYPIICKPANVIAYNHLTFPGKNKIYKVGSKEELGEIIQRIRKGGYEDILILQDFIGGDDSFLYDAVAYCDRYGRVKLLTLAQIGLQEHTNNMVGNAAVLINGYRQHGNAEEIEGKMKAFLEGIGYRGFAEFDLKFDARDGKFKVLEINARQGRSSYYISPLGYNPIRMLTDDLVFEKDLPYRFLQEEILLSFVPKGVVKKYVKNKAFREKALSLWKTKGAVSPVKYKKDKSLMRHLYLLKKHFRYYKEYRNGYWKEN